MANLGRNQPCGCGSGREAKRCCGVRSGPSEESLARAFLAHAAREAAWELRTAPDSELDVALHPELPGLVSPALDGLCDAFVADDPDAAEEPFCELLAAIDTSLERARLASAVLAVRGAGKVDAKFAALAVIDLASDSEILLGASLLHAVALRSGAARTPAGILLAA
jgi:SEC-C motif